MTTASTRTGAPSIYWAQWPKHWKHSCCPKYRHIPFQMLNIAFGRNTRHMLHCRRSQTPMMKRKKAAHRTVLISLNLTAAFDKVDHQHPHDCVYITNIPGTIRHWFHNYMQNSRAKVHLRQQESNSRKVKIGMVQGGIISPVLFNYYLADFPTPPPIIMLIKYADDITIYTSGLVVSDLINGLNIYLLQVLDYINNKNKQCQRPNIQ